MLVHVGRCVHNSGVVSNLNIWRIDNAQVTSNFDRSTGGMLRLPSWVKTEDLPEENSVDEICQYGFQLHNTNGMTFSTGAVDLTPDATVTQQLVYCELAVGRARVAEPDEISKSCVIPEGYDSLYISQKPIDSNNDGQISTEEYNAAANFGFRDSRCVDVHSLCVIHSFSSTCDICLVQSVNTPISTLFQKDYM